MKILSLNVNGLRGMQGSALPCSPLDIAGKIMDIIREESPGIVIFQEFPISRPAGKLIRRALEEQSYTCVLPNQEREISGPYSITAAFAKAGDVERYSSPFSKIWKWCGFRVGDLRVVGIHIPDGKCFLDEIEAYAKEYRDERLIILGDFNIATNLDRTRARLQELEDLKEARMTLEEFEKAWSIHKMIDCASFFARQAWLWKIMPALGYTDAMDSEVPTFFGEKGGVQTETTIDHVLVSPALQGKVTARAEKRGVSDHAAVVVDVRL